MANRLTSPWCDYCGSKRLYVKHVHTLTRTFRATIPCRCHPSDGDIAAECHYELTTRYEDSIPLDDHSRQNRVIERLPRLVRKYQLYCPDCREHATVSDWKHEEEGAPNVQTEDRSIFCEECGRKLSADSQASASDAWTMRGSDGRTQLGNGETERAPASHV